MVEKNTSVSDSGIVARLHWTAPVSCAVSVCAAPLLALESGFIDLSPVSPLYRVLPLLMPVFQFVAGWLPLLLSLLAFLFGWIALAISSRPQWRKGRWLAIIGVALPGLVLLLSGAVFVYVLFFWHPHFHFVGEVRLPWSANPFERVIDGSGRLAGNQAARGSGMARGSQMSRSHLHGYATTRVPTHTAILRACFAYILDGSRSSA